MDSTRRDFLHTSALAAAAGAVGTPVTTQAQTDGAPAEPPGTPEAAAFKKHLLRCLGGDWPDPPALEAKVANTVQKDGYRIETVVYTTEIKPHHRVQALLLVPEEMARSFNDDPVYVVGSGQASDVALHDRPDPTAIRAAQVAGQQAYEMAGVTPADIKVAEVHDCFTIAEVIATEDLGFYPPGDGYNAAEEGLTARTGPRPINTSGGLKSKGHPVGASGAGQAVEAWKQLRGVAGHRQVTGVDLALTHNVGGTGQTCVVHIFERR